MVDMEDRLTAIEEMAKLSFTVSGHNLDQVTIKDLRDRLIVLVKDFMPQITMKQVSDITRNLEIWLDDNQSPLAGLRRRIY